MPWFNLNREHEYFNSKTYPDGDIDKNKHNHMKRVSVQVSTHILPEERDKLDKVVKDYNFKSRYQLIQAIVRTFLKTVAPEEGEFVCKDIEEMFEGYETASLADYDTIKRGTSI